MAFVSAERAQVDSFTAMVCAVPGSSATDIPIDAEWMVIGGDESKSSTAFFPGSFSIKEFDMSWGVNMEGTGCKPH